MKIAVITTGDELVAGDVMDTNAPWISSHCWQRGAPVVCRITVGDDEKAIGEFCQVAAKKADVVLVTGGLGPTVDDITLAAVAKAFGKKLIPHHAFEKEIKLPDGARPLANIVGTAPGCQVELGGAEFFFFPGIPKELYPMFENFFLPWLEEKCKGIYYEERVLKCFGVREANIDTALQGIDLKGCTLSFRVHFPEVWLKLRLTGKNKPEVIKQIDLAEQNVRKEVREFIYGKGSDTLAGVVGKLLHQRGETIAVAESCTGGEIMNAITNIPGASQYFDRGVVSYSNESKRDLLGVAEELIVKHGAVSEATAKSMAEGAQRISKTTYGIGVSGIAGPGGCSEEKPVGTVYIALASPKGTEVQHHCFPRDRLEFKQIVAATALDWLRKELMS